jgi:hypothetical protein
MFKRYGIQVIMVLLGLLIPFALSCSQATSTTTVEITEYVTVTATTTSTLTVPAIPSNYSLIFSYGTGEVKNELNTIKGTYTKDMISAPPITVNLSLAQEEMDRIYKKMQEIDFFNYPTDFSIQSSGTTTIVSTPSEKYYFKVIDGSRTKEVSWDDKIKNPDIQASKLRELIQLIKSIISSKDEYKALPPASGGYG